MDATRTMAPSVYARAAMMRRAASRRRTINVNRTPNAPLAWEQTQGVMAVTYEATEPYGYGGPNMGETRKARGFQHPASHKPRRFSPARRDEFGPILRGYEVTRYGVHYRTRLVGIERKRYVRNDAWARERSAAVGQAKVRETKTYAIALRAENVSGVGPGTYPRIWTPSGARPRFKDTGYADLSRGGESPTAESLWVERWGVIDGQAYRFRFNRMTGEWRKPRA